MAMKLARLANEKAKARARAFVTSLASPAAWLRVAEPKAEAKVERKAAKDAEASPRPWAHGTEGPAVAKLGMDVVDARNREVSVLAHR